MHGRRLVAPAPSHPVADRHSLRQTRARPRIGAEEPSWPAVVTAHPGRNVRVDVADQLQSFGCGAVDEEAHQELLRELGSLEVTVYPAFLRQSQDLGRWDLESATTVALAIERLGLGSAMWDCPRRSLRLPQGGAQEKPEPTVEKPVQELRHGERQRPGGEEVCVDFLGVEVRAHQLGELLAGATKNGPRDRPFR